jgi:transcriptional regulator with XRE-family HTH domain
LGAMANERLRAVLLDKGITPEDLAGRLGVNAKTVQRWITQGREPYRRHRHQIAAIAGVEESYLWPDALSTEQIAEASNDELMAAFAHRSDVSAALWRHHFEHAERQIDVLVYAGMFLAEDGAILRTFAEKAKAGVQLRILLGDPDSPAVADRAVEEGAEGAMAAKISSVFPHYRPLAKLDGVEIRLHDTVLYNSIYRADDYLLVNTHVYGMPAARGPVWHMRKVAGGELVSTFVECFELIWSAAKPWPGE